MMKRFITIASFFLVLVLMLIVFLNYREITVLKTEKKVLQETNVELVNEKNDLVTQNETLKVDNSNLEVKINELKSTANGLEVTVNGLESSVNEKDKEISDLKQQLSLTPLGYIAWYGNKLHYNENEITQLIKICLAESRGIPTATNTSANGNVHYGLFQISSCHKQYSPTELLTIKGNVNAAFELYGGQGTKPWSSSKSVWNK